MKNNKGFSLFEVVTAVAILAVLSVSFMSIIVGVRNQTNAELANSHVSEILSESKNRIVEDISDANIGVTVFDNTDGSSAAEKCKILATYKMSETKNLVTKTYYKYEDETHNIYRAVTTGGYNAEHGVEENLTDILLATDGKWQQFLGDWLIYVDDIPEFDLATYQDVNLTNLNLTVQYDGRKFNAKRSVFTKSIFKSSDLIQAH